MRLQKSFGKAIRTALLLTVSTLSLAGVASAQDKPHWDTWGDSQPLNQQFHDVCNGQQSNVANNHVQIQQQNILREATSEIRASNTAFGFFMIQGDDICLSPADVPISVDHNGFLQNTGPEARENTKTTTIMAIADKLVDKDLDMRGYPASKFAHSYGVEDHFRRAVQLSRLAEIFYELKDSGNEKPLQRAMNSRYGQVFRNFSSHVQSDVENGQAHMNAIKAYFKSYYKPRGSNYYGHWHGQSQPLESGSIFADDTEYGSKYTDLYGMGNRAGKSNIFQSMGSRGFNLQHFLPPAPQNQSFHYPRRP